MVAADGNIFNQDGEINLNASNTETYQHPSDELEDQADLRLDSAVSGYRGGIGDSIDIIIAGN